MDEHRSETDTTAETELGDDIISIVTVFGARLHGARGGRKRRIRRVESEEVENGSWGGTNARGGTGGGA